MGVGGRQSWALGEIRRLIQVAQPGQRLPAEVHLARAMGVSRATVRSALGVLESEGLVTRRHGYGTSVASPESSRPGAPLEMVWSVYDVMRDMGYVPSLRWHEADIIVAPPPVREALRLETNARLFRAVRVIAANDVPALYMVDHLPEPLGHILLAEDSFPGDMLKFLSERVSLSMSYADTRLSAAGAGKLVAEALVVPRGSPTLYTEQTVFSQDHQPLVFSQGWYREGYVTYQVRRQMAR